MSENRIYNFHLMFEPRQDWARKILDAPAREAFARKAKADRFAWATAELLANGKDAEANTHALQGIALIGEAHFTPLCKRYAISVFQVPPSTATEFLKGVLSREPENATPEPSSA